MENEYKYALSCISYDDVKYWEGVLYDLNYETKIIVDNDPIRYGEIEIPKKRPVYDVYFIPVDEEDYKIVRRWVLGII